MINNGLIYDQFEIDSIDNEKWLPIPQTLYPNINPYYYISTNGRIWSSIIRNVMSTSLTRNGYVSVSLSTINRNIHKSFPILVHRTEMLLFNWIPGCEYLDVNHKDGIKTNNNISNLEWVTKSENIKHAYDHGLKLKGEYHPMSTHTEEQVRKICEGLENRLTLLECAKLAGLEQNHTNKAFVSRIKHGNIWTNISSQYNIHKGCNSQLFDDDEIHKICKLMEQGLSNDEIVKIVRPELTKPQYKNVMNSIRNRARFTRISDNYNF